MKLDKNNIALTSSYEVKQLLAPLTALHITYFAYTKAYSDGSRARLTTHPEHITAWFEEKMYLQGNANAKIDLYHNQAILFSTLPNQYPVKWAEEHFNIAHGMHLIRKTDDSCEFFMFASTLDHPEVVNVYLNHLDIFERFCNYFVVQAADLLIKPEKQKIITTFHDTGIKLYPKSAIEQINWILSGQNNELSKRQWECVHLLLEGHSTKTIAWQLGLSARTVEKYINTIKIKLSVKTKAQLIIKLKDLL